MSDIKQVIVMRTDLGMRKGKMIAQGAHAAMMFLTKRMDNLYNHAGYFTKIVLFEPEIEWVEGNFKKICVRVDSEEELVEIDKKAQQAGLVHCMCVDSGLTEFHGVPTRTCLAIGPDHAEKIDKITGDLKLL